MRIVILFQKVNQHSKLIWHVIIVVFCKINHFCNTLLSQNLELKTKGCEISNSLEPDEFEISIIEVRSE